MTLKNVGDPKKVGEGFRLLLYSDPHLHDWSACATINEDGVNTRLQAGINVIHQLQEEAYRYEVQSVNCLGDLTHVGDKRIPAAVADLGFRALVGLHVRGQKYDDHIITGNHDQPDGVNSSALVALDQWEHVKVVDQPHWAALSERRVFFLPYYRDLDALRATLQKIMEEGDVLFLHQGIQGADVGVEKEYFLKDKELLLEDFEIDGKRMPAAVISGHYHQAQELHDGFALYVGQAIQQRFGDVGNKCSAMLLDLASLEYARLPLRAPRFHKIEVKLAKDLKQTKADLKTDIGGYVWTLIQPGSKLTPAKVREQLKDADFVRVDDLRKEEKEPIRVPIITTGMGNEEILRAYFKEHPPPRPMNVPECYWLVYDVETQTGVDEVGGWGNKDKLRVSVAVAWQSDTEKWTAYPEQELPNLFKAMEGAALNVSFNGLNFDNVVLQKYAGDLVLADLPHLDIMVEIRKTLGHLIGLDACASASLGTQKSGHGLQAVKWFKEWATAGREQSWHQLVAYCAQDVIVTRDLFIYGQKHGHIKCVTKKGPKEPKVQFLLSLSTDQEEGQGLDVDDLVQLGMEYLGRVEV